MLDTVTPNYITCGVKKICYSYIFVLSPEGDVIIHWGTLKRNNIPHVDVGEPLQVKYGYRAKGLIGVDVRRIWSSKENTGKITNGGVR